VPHKKRNLLGALVCAIFLLLIPVVDASAQATSDQDVKAGILVNILKFVDWPDDNTSQSDTITIGIIGDGPLGDAFKPVEGQAIQGKKLIIKRYGIYEEGSDYSAVHLLFISDSERTNLINILSTLKTSRVLTVSDIDNFTEHDGMIYLFLENDGTIGFDINQKSVSEADLKLNSGLFRLARNVIQKN